MRNEPQIPPAHLDGTLSQPRTDVQPRLAPPDLEVHLCFSLLRSLRRAPSTYFLVSVTIHSSAAASSSSTMARIR